MTLFSRLAAGLPALLLFALLLAGPGLDAAEAATSPLRPDVAGPPGETLAAPVAFQGQAAAAPETREAGGASAWQQVMAWVMTQQRELHRELAGAVRTLREEHSFAAAWSLILLSFLYGLFHAAGPGHGKAIVSTYLLTHESAVKRGLFIAAASALLQGVTAIALVQVLFVLFDLGRHATQASVGYLESASFALIALLGAALALRALLSLRRRLQPAAGAHHHHHHDHGHEGCGHRHGPEAAELQRPLTLGATLGMILSIGIRPCSGAILVLLFAAALDLPLAGMAAVLAMSIGTGLAVSGLALLAVGSRRLASRWVSASESGLLVLAGPAIALTGGLLILALGGILFMGSLAPAHPLL